MLIPITLASRWGPIDDWGMLEYLMSDISRTQLITSLADSGRFYPLYRVEWDLLSKIIIDPFLFYAFNFIEALIACYLLYHITKNYSNRHIGLLLTFTLILTPAFVTSFYRLGVPDKNSFFLFVIGFYFIQKSLSKYNHLKKDCLYILTAFVSINLALYFKEPGFILVSIFALVFNFLNYWYNKQMYEQKKNKILAILALSIISSFVFLLLYIGFLHTTNSTATVDSNYAAGFNPDTTFVKKVLLLIQSFIWFLFADPLIVFISPLILILRVLKRKEFMQNITIGDNRLNLFIADSALIAALSYTCFYLFTSIINYHYLLPAYAFLLPALAIYTNILVNNKTLRQQMLPRTEKVRKLMTFMFTLLIIGSIVTGINQMILLKYIPYNMNNFLDNSVPIIKEDIYKKHADQKANLFLLGVDRKQYIELYHSLPTYLRMRGIDTNQIDIKSADKVDSGFQPRESLEIYTALQTRNTQIPEEGDYIVIMPYSRRDEAKMINSLKEQYKVELQCLYKTENKYFFQLPFPIQIIRQLAKETGMYKSEEVFYWTSGYSLYVVK